MALDEQDGQIRLEIVLDDGSVQKGFAKVSKEGDKAGKSLGASFSAGFAASIAAVGATIASGAFLRAAIREAVEAESIQKRFNLALANTGAFTQEASKRFNDYALELAKVSGVDDDLIVKNASLLVSLGRLSGDGLERSTKAALDLSAALGIGVDSAFNIVAKAAAGNTVALGRYGIQVDKALTQSQQFEQVLAQIEKRFSGAAAASTNTFGGAIERLQVGFGNTLQSVGELITKSPSVITFFNKLADLFFNISETISGFQGRDIFKSTILGVLDFAQAIAGFFVPFIEVAINLVDFLIERFVKFIVNIGFFGDALKVFASTIAQEVTKIVGTIISDVVSVFSQSAAESIREKTSSFVASLAPDESTIQGAKAIFGGIGEGLAEAFETPFSKKIVNTIEDFRQAVGNAKPVTEDLKNNISETTQEISKSVEDMVKKINGLISGGLVASISAGIQRLGASLNEGTSAFNGFLGQLGNILGDLAINIGQTLLATGLGIEALKNSLLALSGGPAIVAGLALIALGGFLKSVASGSLQSAATGSSSPSEVAAPVTDTAGGVEELSREQSRTAPDTQVVVNIQGDVLDSDETGIRIIDVLNTAFDKKGVTLRRGIA